jgi:hypothetical protein
VNTDNAAEEYCVVKCVHPCYGFSDELQQTEICGALGVVLYEKEDITVVEMSIGGFLAQHYTCYNNDIEKL